jgi:tetratricopeptide (TPR) repeat protein
VLPDIGQIVAKPESVHRGRATLGAALLAFALVACDGDSGSGTAPAPNAPPSALPPDAQFVGGQVCAGCHAPEANLWRGSQHALAMQNADESTVLGDFDDAEFVYGGVTSRFFRSDGEYFVRTDGPDGISAEFAVTRTFGVYPLQQYLIELDGGRIQALDIAWDVRPAESGGQRWFHLHPDEDIDYRDPLHWTGTFLRWNTMCADCHSTGLVKGYDRIADRFDTRFASIDVDCEACHGPGSAHAADPAMALPALPARPHGWVFGEGDSIATRNPRGAPQEEIDVCAQCHSRRSQLTDAHEPGDPLLDGYRPALLTEGLYHDDGQILDEVFVYGSFLQSAMARAGVTCSDCHEPHSGGMRAEGNALCARCHLASTYDRPEHHRHEARTRAAECTACHMRSETYMVVDPRRDHSFRVPRPDLSERLDSPNACNDCHDDRTSEWAADQIEAWYPAGRWTEPHYGEALHAARTWSTDARGRLLTLIADEREPAIARATALTLLPGRMTLADLPVVEASLEDESPLVRLAAIELTAQLPPEMRIDLVQRFLTSDLLALRVAAARVLLPAAGTLSERRRSDLEAATAELLAVQSFNSDLAQGLLNESAIAIDQGRPADAEQALHDGVARHPADTALAVNLAELYRITGRSTEAEQVLRDALVANPDDAAVPLSLGLILVGDGRADEGLPYFEQAASRAEDQPYYQYVLALAYNDSGDTSRALDLLRETHERFPGHVDTTIALATILRDAGAIEQALAYARDLVALLPGDTNARALQRELEQQL